MPSLSLLSSLFVIVIITIPYISAYTVQIWTDPDRPCQGTPTVVTLKDGVCDSFNGFAQIGTCNAAKTQITIVAYEDLQCKKPRDNGRLTANVNTCTLGVVKYSCGAAPIQPITSATTSPPVTSSSAAPAPGTSNSSIIPTGSTAGTTGTGGNNNPSTSSGLQNHASSSYGYQSMIATIITLFIIVCML